MSTTKKLWLGLAALLIASFSVMLWLGADLHQTAPPIPNRVVTDTGKVLYTRAETKLPLTDTHNGLRVMSRGFASGLQLRERGMGHATEILEHVADSGARWVEVPVHIRYTDYSKAKGQPMINSVNILFDSLFR